MSLVLTIEQGPHAQAVRQARLDHGEMVIGRSPEADWQIDDPDQFVSRSHCRITGGQDGYVVTDTSSSGLFIDGSSQPLGTGNSARLLGGMTLRLGDYVLGVEVQDAKAHAHTAPPSGSAIASDDFFSIDTEEPPSQPRPSDMPNPFEYREREAQHEPDESGKSPAFDDPFSLDPVPTPARSVASDEGESDWSGPVSFEPARREREPAPARREAPPADDFGFAPRLPSVENASGGAGSNVHGSGVGTPPWDLPAEAAATPSISAPRPAADALALRAAFLRGAGADGELAGGADPVAEMERFGREYRLMMDGLMQLLRKRAEEKGNARVAQTVVGASEVNPLKFLPTVDDAIAMIISNRSAGFLPGEKAIADAVRDLAQHHVRAWRGIQEALRRMVDRFDPASLEQELKSGSSLETLLAGGRSAKLWDLYQKRHHEIAKSAESRFLGEIGADFRDAYEGEE